MHKPAYVILVALAMLMAACGDENPSPGTGLPVFITPTLAMIPTPRPTDTPLPPTATPTAPPIVGVTTTQINVRIQPSTTSSVLGVIPVSSSVQVIGKDASGTWYQVAYPESPQAKGWILATYVQVALGAEIPVISVGSAPAATASVLVIQRLNVRSGPGTQYESLGILNANDVAALTGKDSSGAWLQIEFASAPDGRGWVNTGFVQAAGAESLPVIAGTEQASGVATQAEISVTSIPTSQSAMQDGDSASAPSILVTFSPSGARTLQFSGDVSAPQGDNEDWIQFTPFDAEIEILVTCSGSKNIKVELWQNGTALPAHEFYCGVSDLFVVDSRGKYLLVVKATSTAEQSVTNYQVKIDQLK